jgi:hypothetical protein
MQVRQVARTVLPGVTGAHAYGAPLRAGPAAHMSSRGCGCPLVRGLSPARPVSTHCFISVPGAGLG